MRVLSMSQVACLLMLLSSLAACQTNTKTRNELIFPAGVHTWHNGSDYNASQPSDNCEGCPSLVTTTPSFTELNRKGWLLTLDQGRSTFDLQGYIEDAGIGDCGPHNDLICSNEWRIWPPGADGQMGYVTTPGGALPKRGTFDLNPSFQCGLSRLVLVSENTYGLTRFILDVDRRGGVCEATNEEPALNVRLVWGTQNTDLDLHLVRNDGELNSSDDCYYGNCGPVNELGTSGLDWGVTGVAADNPLLDVDDTEEGGPENIFLHRAADGFYDVYVHYFEGFAETYPEIEVWYGTRLVDIVYYSANLPAMTQGGLWHAATIYPGEEGTWVEDTNQTLTFVGR